MKSALLPQKWHVYTVDLDPRVGTKPGKRRPCLSIQPDELNQAGLQSTVVIPLTTKLTKEDAFPLRVRVPQGSCLVEKESDLLIDQILAWDNSLFREDLGMLPQEIQDRVKSALKDFLELD